MLSTLLTSALLVASSASAATILDLSTDATQVATLLQEPVDYVVVGGGNAGLTVAARLAASKRNFKVVVLEAGQNDPTNSGILVPGLAGSTLGNTSVDWAFSTVPQEHADGRAVFSPRGKTLGGSSALNLLVYTRPDAADIDEWEKLGNGKGWSWKGLLPYFKKVNESSNRLSCLKASLTMLSNRPRSFILLKMSNRRTRPSKSHTTLQFTESLVRSQTPTLRISLLASTVSSRLSEVSVFLRQRIYRLEIVTVSLSLLQLNVPIPKLVLLRPTTVSSSKCLSLDLD